MNCKPMQRKCLQQLASCSICHSSVVSATGSSPLACSSASWELGRRYVRTKTAGFFFPCRHRRLLRSSFLSSSSSWWVRAPFFLQLVALYCSRACICICEEWLTEHGGVHAFFCSAMKFFHLSVQVSGQIFIATDGMCSPNCSKSQVLIPVEEKNK